MVRAHPQQHTDWIFQNLISRGRKLDPLLGILRVNFIHSWWDDPICAWLPHSYWTRATQTEATGAILSKQFPISFNHEIIPRLEFNFEFYLHRDVDDVLTLLHSPDISKVSIYTLNAQLLLQVHSCLRWCMLESTVNRAYTDRINISEQRRKVNDKTVIKFDSSSSGSIRREIMFLSHKQQKNNFAASRGRRLCRRWEETHISNE